MIGGECSNLVFDKVIKHYNLQNIVEAPKESIHPYNTVYNTQNPREFTDNKFCRMDWCKWNNMWGIHVYGSSFNKWQEFYKGQIQKDCLIGEIFLEYGKEFANNYLIQ